MRIISFLILPFSIHSGYAQVADKPVLNLIAGQPVKAVWANGNEAEIQFFRTAVVRPTVEMQITENLCTPEKGDAVTITRPVRVDLVFWAWSKHSDPKKIGQMLTGKLEPNGRIFRLLYITNSQRANHPDLMMGLPADTLSFTNLKWLPAMGESLMPFTIDSSMKELMLTNSQTGVSENRIVAADYGIHVRPTGPLSAEIDRVDSTFLLPAVNFEFPFIEDVVSWSLNNEKGPCLISFKPNNGPAITELVSALGNIKGPFKPYLWQQDSLLNLLETLDGKFMKESLWYAE